MLPGIIFLTSGQCEKLFEMVFIYFTSGLFACLLFLVHDLIRFACDKWSSCFFERFHLLVSHLALHFSSWCIYGIIINLLFHRHKILGIVVAMLVALLMIRRFCAHVDVHARKRRDIFICTVSLLVCFGVLAFVFHTAIAISRATSSSSGNSDNSDYSN